MKIWIYLNGVQQGPYTYDELVMMPLEPTTPVWYDGLPAWTAAAEAPVTAPLFAAPAPPPQPEGECGPAVWSAAPRWQAPAQAGYEPADVNQSVSNEPIPPRPDTYLIWSILITLLCCNPLSIAAIVTGAITNSRYNSGDYAGSRRMSGVTEWLVILAIVLGVLALPLTLLVALWA